MSVSGNLQKMVSEIGQPVKYALPLGDALLPLNPLLGKGVSLRYLKEIHCVSCGRKTGKSYNQGHCYQCMRTLARCDICMVRPELCHFSQGTCREPLWGEKHCMREHFVYLANSSALKVGITRAHQAQVRWIDQGATQALPFFKVKNRYVAGLVEVALKKQVSDRTDWRKMLKRSPRPEDLAAKGKEFSAIIADEIAAIKQKDGKDAIVVSEESGQIEIEYPVLKHPVVVRALNFDKTPDIRGILLGIKGQYLILDTGVLNIRKFSGYKVEVAQSEYLVQQTLPL